MTRAARSLALLALGSAAAALACAAPTPSPAAAVEVRRSALTTDVTVTVLDTDDTPQTGSTVYAEDTDGNVVDYADVDANGHAVIALDAGSYRFAVPGLPGGFFYTSAVCSVPSCSSASVTVLPPVTVSVVDGWGNPVAGVEVDADDPDDNLDNTGVTDDQGQLAISVDPGTYHFRVSYGGALFDSDPCTAPGCSSATVQIQKPVQVTVTDGYGGTRSDVDLAAIDTGGNQVAWATTDASGLASMYMAPGAYFIRAYLGGSYFDSGLDGSCAIPGCTEVSIAATDVVVTVTGSDGNPVVGEVVTALLPDGTQVAWPTTDDLGNADAFVAAGAYTFRVSVGGSDFYSGPDGHCVVPGCRTATITAVPAADCTGQPSGTPCPDDGNPCTLDQCDGTTNACQHPTGNAGAVCREAADECDVVETCTGTSPTCPVDGKRPSGTLCTDDGNPCTLDQCDGISNACQHPAGNAGTVCRAQNGDCDLAETCTGTSTSCPGDAKKTSGTVCTDDGNPCTQDQCDGNNVACQHPAGNAGTVCRASSGICDIQEVCTGITTNCPADAFAAPTTVCRPAKGVCDSSETCTGISADCPTDTVVPPTSECAAPSSLVTLDDSLVGVKALSTANADGSYTYSYTVTNLDNTRYLRGLDIGFNRTSSILELSSPPIDWSDDPDGGLTALTAESPSNWGLPRLVFFEESSGHFLRWSAVDGEPGIAPGFTLTGFSVTTPQSDSSYLTGHWTARFGSGLSASSVLRSDLIPTYAINCGGETIAQFSADTFFDGGSTITGGPIDISPVSNPAPADAYSSARIGQFTYTFSSLVPGASYVVRLHFADLVYSTVGQRIFDVTANGSTVLSAFDVVREFGAAHAGVVEYRTVAPSNGTLVIDFLSNHVDVAICNGLEIIEGTTPPAPPVHLIATPHDGAVTISWDNVNLPTFITVYRGVQAGTESMYARINPVGSNETLRIPTTNGQPYFFRLSSTADGIEGGRTIEVSVTSMAGLP